MSARGFARSLAAALALFALCGAGFAAAQAGAQADAIRARQAAFRSMGAAFKGVNDAVRAREIDAAAVRTHAASVADLAQRLPQWFPAGSGIGGGAPTAAKAEIWSNTAAFQERARSLREAARTLESAAAAGQTAQLAARARAVAAQCSSCHTEFRERRRQ